MSANSMRRGRRRTRVDALIEAGKPRQGRGQKENTLCTDRDATIDERFQTISEQIGKISNLISALEREQVSTSTTSLESTISTPQISDPLIPRTNNTINNVSSVESSISGLQTNNHQAPCVNSSIDNAAVASGSGSGNIFMIRPTIDKPSFSGRGEASPMKFLKKFKRYVDCINGHSRIADIVSGCLTGTALKLMEIFSDEWETLADFERDFQKVFWGQRDQERAKYKFVNSFWDSRSGNTMSEHFAEQIDSVRLLTIPLSECEMVNSAMRHFPTDIQRLWFTKNNNVTVSTGIEFLANLEQNIINRTDEHPIIDKSSRGSGDRGRGGLSHVDNINSAPAVRGQGSYRGRRDRGWSAYRGNGGNSLPAIQFVKPTEANSDAKVQTDS